jgi:hypothetical protein
MKTAEETKDTLFVDSLVVVAIVILNSIWIGLLSFWALKTAFLLGCKFVKLISGM